MIKTFIKEDAGLRPSALLHLLFLKLLISGICRITWNGLSAESRVSAQQAWTKLHAAQKDRLSGQEGLLAFGLKGPQVRQLIQQLPNASRCERYSCWGEDSVPEKVKLVGS